MKAAKTQVTPQQRRQDLKFGILVLVGLALVAAGVVAVFVSSTDVGAAALLGFGAALVALGSIGDRLKSLEYKDLKLVLLGEAELAEDRGEPEKAELLRRAADAIGRQVATTARSYKSIRTGMPPGTERTALMSAIIEEAGKEAHTLNPEDDDLVLSLLWTGSEGARVWALGVLQERPEFATTRAILEAVQRPDQMFDQCQALELANKFLSLKGTPIWTWERITEAVRAHMEDPKKLGSDQQSIDAAKRVLAIPKPAKAERQDGL